VLPGSGHSFRSTDIGVPAPISESRTTDHHVEDRCEDIGDLCRLRLNMGRQSDHLPHEPGGCDVPDRRRFDADGLTPLCIAEGY
jgi:hypothetical protein